MHVLRDNDGPTLYFGHGKGAPFIGVSFKGFHGWQSSMHLKKGWMFFNPSLHLGRLYQQNGRYYSRQVLFPARLWDMLHRHE